jgi:twinkle protein
LDKYRLQERAIHELRAFATSRKIHITIVAHPRKEMGATVLSLDSISGSAKITQEADNVMLLQRVKGAPRLDVVKNRYDGTLANIQLKFDQGSMCVRICYFIGISHNVLCELLGKFRS